MTRPTKRKVDKTGRNSSAEGFHIRLYGWMLNSEAWRALTAGGRGCDAQYAPGSLEYARALKLNGGS